VTGGTTGTGGSTATGGAGGTTGSGSDAGVSDAGIDAPATDGGALDDDGGASNSEVGADTGSVSGPEVGPDAPVDSPFDAAVGEVGDALSIDGEADNCYLAIKNNNYAAGSATPCGSCMDNNSAPKALECTAALDCLAAHGMSCRPGGEGNCYLDCLNAGGGPGAAGGICAINLITAAGCQ
jgi:hypothetical protein